MQYSAWKFFENAKFRKFFAQYQAKIMRKKICYTMTFINLSTSWPCPGSGPPRCRCWRRGQRSRAPACSPSHTPSRRALGKLKVQMGGAVCKLVLEVGAGCCRWFVSFNSFYDFNIKIRASLFTLDFGKVLWNGLYSIDLWPRGLVSSGFWFGRCTELQPLCHPWSKQIFWLTQGCKLETFISLI